MFSSLTRVNQERFHGETYQRIISVPSPPDRISIAHLPVISSTSLETGPASAFVRRRDGCMKMSLDEICDAVARRELTGTICSLVRRAGQ